MMLLVTLVLVIGLAVGQSPQKTAYSKGNEYIYKYESQVVSGLPDGASTYSGLKLESDVYIQIIDDWDVKMQMVDVRLYKINDVVDSKDPKKEMLPTELFDELIDGDLEELKHHLLKPVNFTYVQGHITDVTTEKDDPTWSVDIKKSLPSLLELNFNDRNSLDSDVQVKSDDEKTKIYRVMEPSVVGECETTYKVKKDRDNTGVPSMKIEKLRNYEKCMEKVVFTQGLLNTFPTEHTHLPQVPGPLKVQSSVKYSILGSPDRFVILSASAQSQYHVTPCTETRGKISTFSNQTATLIDARPISVQIRDLRTAMKQTRPLRATSLLKKDPLKPDTVTIGDEEKDETLKKVEKVLKALEIFVADRVNQATGDLIEELTHHLKKLDKPSLDIVLDDICKDGKPNAKKIVLDILPTLGTYPSIVTLMERLEDGRIDKDSAIPIIMALAQLPQPDAFMIRRYLAFTNSKTRRTILDQIDDKILRRTILLTLGSLGNKMDKIMQEPVKDLEKQQKILSQIREDVNDRNLRRNLDKQIQESKDKRKNIEDLYNKEKQEIVKIVKAIMSEDDQNSKLLALKVTTALAFKELYPSVETFIKDTSSPRLLRIEAINSLKAFVHHTPDQEDAPNKVRDVLLPLFFDRQSPEDVRMTAFITFLYTTPTQPDLELIAKSLEDEPSPNVASLVYKSMLDLSKETGTTCEQIQIMSKRCTQALHFAKKPEDPLQISTFVYKSSYDKKLGMGHAYEQTVLRTSEERSPRVASLKYSTFILGRYVDMIEIGVRAKGLDTILDDILTGSDDTELNSLLKLVLHPRQRGSVKPTEDIIKSIKDKLGVKPRSPIKPEGHVSVTLFGQELIYLDIQDILNTPQTNDDQETQPGSILRSLKDKVDIVSIVDFLKKLMRSQKTLRLPLHQVSLPTEAGLPLRLNIDKIGTIKLDGDIQFPDQSNDLSKLKMLVDMKPSGLLEIRGKVEIDMKRVQTGVQVKARAHLDMPLKLDITAQPDNTKLAVKIDDRQLFKPMRLESRIHTIVTRRPFNVEDYPKRPELREISVTDGADLKPFSYETDKDLFGRKITVSGVRSVRRNDLSPLPILNGKQVVHIKYEPKPDSQLRIQFQHVSNADPIQNKVESSRRWWQKIPQMSFFSKKSSSDSFIDLDSDDLSVKRLQDKFEEDTDILPDGDKRALVIVLVDSEETDAQRVQVSTLYQRDPTDNKVHYTVELKRAARLDETQPFRIVADIRATLPKSDVKPSDLLNDEYQKDILKEIQLSITENGRRVDSLLELTSDIVTKSSQQLKKYLKPDRQHKIIDDLINLMLQKDFDEVRDNDDVRDTDRAVLVKMIQKQRKLERDISKLMKNPTDPAKIKDQLDEFRDKVEKCQEVLDEVSQKLDSKRPDIKKPEEDVLIRRIVAGQIKTKKMLIEISDKLRPALDFPDQKDTEEKTEELKKKLNDVRDKLRQYSSDKLDMEILDPRPELSEDDKKRFDDLLKIEKDLMAFKDLKSDRDIPIDEDMKNKVKDLLRIITTETELAKTKIDDKLIKEPKLDKSLKTKCIEVLLKVIMLIEDLENVERQREKREAVKSLSSVTLPRDDLADQDWKETEAYRHRLDKVVKQISEILALIADFETKTKALDTSITQDDETTFKQLFRIEIKQFQAVDQIMIKDRDNKIDNGNDIPSKDTLLKVVDTLKETTKDLKDIIDEETQRKDQGKLLRPVFIHSIEVTTKQLDVLEKAKQILQSILTKLATTDDADIDTCKQLKADVEQAIFEVVKILKQSRTIMKVERSDKDPRTDSESLYYRGEPRTDDQSTSLVNVLKKLQKVESKQLRVKSSIEGLSGKVDIPSVTVTKLMDIIMQLVSSQDSLKDVKDFVSRRPDQSQAPVRDAVKELSDRLTTQDNLIQLLDVTELPQPQKATMAMMVRELQDVNKRQKDSVKDVLERIDVDSKLKKPKPTLALNRPKIWEQYRSDEKAAIVSIKIKYGVEDKSQDTTISIRVFGKKSLEHLVWESEQKLTSRQDRLVRDYLMDRRIRDDTTAVHFRNLQTKLNTYKHWHAIVTYQDQVPREVQTLFLQMKEMMKAMYPSDVTVRMPDLTDLIDNNRFDCTWEIRKDDRFTDIEIRTPSDTSLFRTIQTPIFVRDLFRTSDDLDTSFLSPLTTRPRPKTCEISPDRIKTLKGKVIKMNIKIDRDCEKVLTMDCSPRNSLVITSKPVPQTNPSTPQLKHKKVITVLTKDRKVEIIPDTDRVTVKVDDKDVTDSDPKLRADGNKKPVSVRHLKDGRVEVKIPHIDVTVKSDGRKISIKVPERFHSKLCGVCGTLDGNKDQKLSGPRDVKYSKPEPFIASYLIPDSQCDATRIQSQHDVPDIRNRAKLVEPTFVTDVKVKTIQGEKKTCFSINPVKKCPPGTEPQRMATRQISFYCRDSSHPKTYTYLAIVKYRVLSEIVGKRRTSVLDVDCPEMCRRLD